MENDIQNKDSALAFLWLFFVRCMVWFPNLRCILSHIQKCRMRLLEIFKLLTKYVCARKTKCNEFLCVLWIERRERRNSMRMRQTSHFNVMLISNNFKLNLHNAKFARIWFWYAIHDGTWKVSFMIFLPFFPFNANSHHAVFANLELYCSNCTTTSTVAGDHTHTYLHTNNTEINQI